jgi:polysaccharide export outer membrane protein
VLTIVRSPQTFSVFGATGRNAEIAFDTARLRLGEALGESQGLRDDLAKPEASFFSVTSPTPSYVRSISR